MWRRWCLGFCLCRTVLAVPSTACPDVEQGTLQACERCIHDDLCQTDTRLNIKYVCHDFTKKCVNPAWNITEVYSRCPEDLSCCVPGVPGLPELLVGFVLQDPADPSTWGAQCKLTCADQQARSQHRGGHRGDRIPHHGDGRD
ncbi:unnamed protein product [Cladocopium goreaui]|uniref:Uncharacterized protein n=1 Tax=Cladocopium goreaui TaxID=2562237 RepID=A0A9P1FGB4_9DINO|nr:unnamed protein product [Cladocopium goreaui]